jgi:signal transduction histidine kinase
MGLLIEDLLKFSRLGRKGVDLMSLSLGDLVNEAIDLLRDPIADTGAVLRISEGLPRVRGDRLLALQVLVNLLDNALKYTIPDTPPFVEIHAEEASDGVLLSVSDRGIGIPPEYHEKVFKIFQRLHHESEYPGTGVGLASVKKAASIMGCNVRVESAQGKGATFTVRFPADTPQSNAAY